MQKFTRSLILLSAVLLLLIMSWNHFLPSRLTSPHANYILIYFVFSTAIFHHFFIKANAQSPQNFIRTYMASTALKLLLNLIVIIIYILVNREHAIIFVLSFLAIYFVFLIFEIIALQKELRK